MKWTPETLAAAARGRLLARGKREIAGAFIDSRTPLAGGIFVPVIAERDGHTFIPQAIAGGAGAILLARGRPVPEGDVTVVEVDDTVVALADLAAARRARFPGPVVSISGSNGKTTTRALVAAVLAVGGPVLCTAGNLNNHLGVPLTLLGPPADPWAMVVELGMSAPGENDRLAAVVKPSVHVVTSIALEHLEFMHSLAAIAAAEAEPLRHLAAGGLAVLPADEPLLRPHWPVAGRASVVSVGSHGAAGVEVLEAVPGPTTRGRIRVRSGEVVEVALQLFGAHNLRNAAMALAVGEALGLPIAAMVEALAAVEPVGDRGRTLAWGEHLVIADCYNANPGSVAAALQGLAALVAERPGPRVAVLGDMLELGPTESELHADAGRLAAAAADLVVGFGPRSLDTVAAARAAGTEAVHVEAIAEVVAVVLERMCGQRAGAVMIKGSRGMQLERVVAGLFGESEGGEP